MSSCLHTCTKNRLQPVQLAPCQDEEELVVRGTRSGAMDWLIAGIDQIASVSLNPRPPGRGAGAQGAHPVNETVLLLGTISLLQMVIANG